MEFLQGEPLDERLEREQELPCAEVLRIGREIAEGLAAAHATGLIHRDIKPANIWLEAPRNRVKILDFGLARSAQQDAGLTQQGAIIGTPAYMAPEQARGELVDARCDLFSLGVVLYRLCCGQQPFHGSDTISTLLAVATQQPPPPSQTNPDLPPELSDLVMNLLEKDPARRPASAAAVIELLRALENDPRLGKEVPVETVSYVAAPPQEASGSARDGSRTPGKRRLPVLIGALVLGIGLLGMGVGAVIRITTNQGIYTIETDDPAFSFRVNKGTVLLVDSKSKRTYQFKVLHQDQAKGEYELEVTDADLAFQTRTFTIKRGEKVALKAWFEKPEQGPYLIETDDPDFSFRVNKGTVVLEDRKTARKYPIKVLRQDQAKGEYELEVPDTGADLAFKTKTFTIKRGDKVALKPWFERKQGADAQQTVPILDDPWHKQVAAMTPAKQVEAVAARLKERNPGFTGKVELRKVEGGMVTEISFHAGGVFDISPVRALVGLKVFTCPYGRKLSDLSPLKDMKLTSLFCGETQVADLTPLKDMKLTSLICNTTQVSDLSLLKGMPLTHLDCRDTPVADLTPLKDMKLTSLICDRTSVTDLSPLKGMPLKDLWCNFKPERDAEILRSIKTLKTINGKPAKEVLK